MTDHGRHSESRRPKVLIVGGFPRRERSIIGGVVTSSAALLNSDLARRFSLILLDTSQRSHPPPHLMRRLAYATVRLIRFVGLLIRQRPAVVLLFVTNGASLLEKGLMARLARLCRAEALMFPRAGAIASRDQGSGRRLARWAFQPASLCLCQSASMAEFLMSLGTPPDRVTVVPNWTATPELLEVADERFTTRPSKRRREAVVIFVGHLEPQKGVLEFIDAVERVIRTEGTEPRCRLVGGGSLERLIEQRLAGSETLRACVQLEGWLSGDALRDVYREADILVLPSYSEGMPNVVIEAMAAGLAVICTPVGSVPEYLTSGRDALLVEPGDVHALHEALSHLLGDVDSRHRIATSGNAIARKHFSTERAVSVLIDSITDVTDRNT